MSGAGELGLVADELLDRYGRHGPRYTSYPTVPQWSAKVGPTQHVSALRNLRGPDGTRPVEIYVHIPFCERPCSFCGCHMHITRKQEPVEAYLATLERELRRVANEVPEDVQVVGLHFGGGTPTHLDEAQLSRLLDMLEEEFDFSACVERSLEVHPHVTSRGQIDLLYERGFRRISLGVQDLTPDVQKAIHRFQTAEETAALMQHARALGFQSLNVDLIYGLPRQTLEGLTRTVDQVVAMGADRLAVYGYAHVPWLKPVQRGIREEELPGPLLRRDLYRAALVRLHGHGFQAIGLDHFARPEDELFRAQAERTLARGFMGYTVRRSRDLIGLGPSAISDLSSYYTQNRAGLADWTSAVEAEDLATERGFHLNAEDRLRRAVIESILCHLRVHVPEIEQEFGVRFREHFRAEIEALRAPEEDGLLRWEDDGFRLTETGRYLSRNIAMMFDAYLANESSRGPRYSRTV